MIGQSVQELEQIVNTCGPLCVINLNYELTFVNPAFCRLFHVDPQVVGSPYQGIASLSDCHAGNCPLALLRDPARQLNVDAVTGLDGLTSACCGVRAAPYLDSVPSEVTESR